MDNLLCEEDFLNSPFPPWSPRHRVPISGSSLATNREDCKDVLRICLEKEASYTPERGYAELLRAGGLVEARVKAVNWMAQMHERFNLSCETIFCAINLIDRFISLNVSDKLKGWLIELLSVACLSIAAKLEEVYVPPLLELQLDGFGHLFQPSLVQRMELTVLESLAWRLKAVTAHSFMDPLIGCLDLDCPRLRSALTKCVTELLLGAISDVSFLHFWPSSVTVAAIRCGLDKLLPKSNELMLNLLSLIPGERKDETDNCFVLMEESLVDTTSCKHSCSPRSPVSVLTIERIKIMDCMVDFSFLENPDTFSGLPSNPKKRKQESENSVCDSPAPK